MSETQTLQPQATEASSQSFEGFEAIGEAIADAADRNRTLVETGLKVWQDETARFIEDFSAQSSATFSRLCDCKTPIDVLGVEQDWVRFRSHAFLESGLRFAEAFSSVAQGNGTNAPATTEADVKKPNGHAAAAPA